VIARRVLPLAVLVVAVLAAVWFVALDQGSDALIPSGPDGLSVERLHLAVFGHAPDEVVATLATARYADGERVEVLAEEWLQAPEALEAYGDLANAEFVAAVFRRVLDREPNDEERDHWTRQLDSGTSRARLLVELADSAELKRRTGRYVAGTRVLLIGDSLMDETGPLVEERLRALGYETLLDARPGSGLLASHRPVDWLAEMHRLVEEFDPDIVVVEFCCNHWPDRQPEGHPFREVPSGSPEFYEAWAEAVDDAMEILTSGGARLAWVHTPPAADPTINALIDRLNEISAEAARRHGVARIDWAVAISDGAFQPTWGGDPVRDPDGLHLAPAGAERTAVATVAGVMRLS
jgi:hypothetical protein